jgi:putative ABC transport system permease protein
MDALVQDLRYATRSLRRAPGFALLALLVIALGVGANAVMFTLVNAVLLRPLPFPDPGGLMLVSQKDRTTGQDWHDASPANFLDWRARQRTFTGMTALRPLSLALSAGDRVEQIPGGMVNANFFDVLGVKPILGRAFRPDDERPGAPRVAILGYAAWQQRFAGRADVMGHTLRLNDEVHTIVGVMPAGIDYPDEAQVWVPPHVFVPDDPLKPQGEDSRPQRGHGYLTVLARLAPGVTQAQARADMTAVTTGLEREHPDANGDVGAAVVSLRDDLIGDVRPTLLLLFAAVGVLLLIATVNVAGLLMARASGRHQEVALRLALGASRRRIVGQLLTESLLLAVAGGMAGVLLSTWVIGPLIALSPGDLGMASRAASSAGPAVTAAAPDVRVLLFCLAVSTLAGVLFGLAPARQLLRVSLHDDLKQTARGGSGGLRQRRTRSELVTAEIALSLVLVLGAGLTIKSLIRVQQVSPGFDADHVLTASLGLSRTRYPTPREQAAFWTRATDALRAVPGVEAVGATSRLPMTSGNSTRGLTVEGVPADAQPAADYRIVTEDYFRALRIPLRRGQYPTAQDAAAQTSICLVSAAFAQKFWPDRDPIGLHVALASNPPAPVMTVIGVVGDVRHASLEATPHPTLYELSRAKPGQDSYPSMTFALRTSGLPTAVAGAVRDAIARVDKQQPVGALLTMDQRLAGSLARRRFAVVLLSAFGLLAVTLATVGLYGVLAFLVAQRRREIGVRMALGATARDVMRAVIGEGLKLAAVGVLAGLALALAGTRLLAALLYETSTTDVATFAAAALLLLAVATGASALPAFRASRVDPLVALRED